MTAAFLRELEQSGYVHKLLPPDKTRATEARLLAKPTRRTQPLWACGTMGPWEQRGVGDMRLTDAGLHLSTPARRESDDPLPHYVGYNYAGAALRFGEGADWRGFNRLRCRIRPACGGYHSPYMTLGIRNEGAQKIPDVYGREGAHVVNLTNNEWNDCVWEFPDLPQDAVTELSFNISAHGADYRNPADFAFTITDIFLDEVAQPDVAHGWACAADAICYSMSGYFSQGRKQAVVGAMEGAFSLKNAASGAAAFHGKIACVETDMGVFGVADFSNFCEVGEWQLCVNGQITPVFPISNHPFNTAVWKAINFIYAERCGYPVNGGHGFCHGDLIAEHDGRRLVYCGGWHDAGDLSQQTLQTAEVAHALYEAATRHKNDTILYQRLMEEANWGLDFVLRTRFGDGFRATSVGCTRWTDLFIGNADDEPPRVRNRSLDNFIMGAVQAYGALALADYDAEKSFVALQAAREDFAFAAARFAEVGVEPGMMMEHTYNAGASQYYAAAAECAAAIFQASGEAHYAEQAAHFGALLLQCQDTGEAGLPFTGFFYRDETKQVLTHFNHQARDHLYAQALIMLCKTQKNTAPWAAAAQRYGEYLKAMAGFSAPYGMQPAGLHAYNEADDAETFPFLHLYTTHEAERENYRAQLASAQKITDEYCIRQFPVWFSFRGNSAVMLSAGRAAALIGRHFNDAALLEIGRDQLYWHAGKNPFAQSLMYGEGHNYAQQYAALLGETMGEMPVGVQTRANEDVPYWPMANNATYKEVWMSTVGHWLHLAASVQT